MGEHDGDQKERGSLPYSREDKYDVDHGNGTRRILSYDAEEREFMEFLLNLTDESLLEARVEVHLQ